jgi:hypothetical protein
MELEPPEQDPVRARVEDRAAAEGMGIITPELLAHYQ